MSRSGTVTILLLSVLAFARGIQARDIIWSQIHHDVWRSEKLELRKQQVAQAKPSFTQGAEAPAPSTVVLSPPTGSGSGSGSGSASNVTILTNCPTDPLEYCDFYFQGFESSVPLLQLPPNGTNDVPISPAIRDSFRDPADPLGYLEVDATAPGKFLCPAPEGTSQDGTNEQLGNSFYITNANNGSAVFVRNLNNLGNDTILQNRCLLLPITSAQVYPNGSQVVSNINQGDGNSKFPETRRCVIFQTGPTATFCQAIPPAAAPAPVAPPPTSCPPCPASPTETCDFAFQGFETEIPTFNLNNVSSDQPFTPSIEYDANNITVMIEVDSTGPVCTPVNPEDSAFYGVNSQINARNLQNAGPGAYAGGCFKVPLTSVAITLPGTNSPVNVNVGDNNQAFPEDRRCIWFKTQ